jgi:hypothetical protein
MFTCPFVQLSVAHSHGQVLGKEEETPLAKHLKTLIRVSSAQLPGGAF